MDYQAIGFDWGGVLNGQPSSIFNKKIAALVGVGVEQYLDAYFRYNQKFNRGEATLNELWYLVLTDLGRPELISQVTKLSEDANEDNVNADVLNLVDNLRESGYKVGLLSNNTAEYAAQMRKNDLDKHFDAFDISEETGLVKPEPEAYEHLAKALSSPLNKLIFIDDSENSLSLSETCGFTPILFTDYDSLVAKLNGLGVRT